MKLKRPRANQRSLQHLLNHEAAKVPELAAFLIYGVVPGKTPQLMWTLSIADQTIVPHHYDFGVDINIEALVKFCGKPPSEITKDDMDRWRESLRPRLEPEESEASPQPAEALAQDSQELAHRDC